MNINLEKIHQDIITIEFITDHNGETEENDAAVFASIIQKLYKDSNRIGFKQKYTKDEKELIGRLYGIVAVQEPTNEAPNVQEYPNRTTYVQNEKE